MVPSADGGSAADRRDGGRRLAAIREHRDRMRVMERLVREYARTGQGRGSDSLKATYYRLEADQLLVEAGGDDATKVEIPDPAKRSAFATAATGSQCPSVIDAARTFGVPDRDEHRQNSARGPKAFTTIRVAYMRHR